METLKSPVVTIEIPVSATLCLLASVNTFAALLVPTFVTGNVLLAGVNVACTRAGAGEWHSLWTIRSVVGNGQGSSTGSQPGSA